MKFRESGVTLALTVVAAPFLLGGLPGGSDKGSPAGMAAIPSPDAQIAAGNERLRAAAARLKAAARAAETQRGSAAAQNELKVALGEAEASYEYLIGVFSKLTAVDHRKQLELLRHQLDELKKQKQALLSKMTVGAASTGDWRQMLPGIAVLSDQALAAAVVPPARGFVPTPVR